MLVSLRWLRELCPSLSQIDAIPLAEHLTAIGLAVDRVIPVGVGLESCVLAEVRRVEPHPSRSSLRLVTLDVGGAERTVVCGAPNVPEPPGLVVLAPLGARLPGLGGQPLAERTIGGIPSAGMLVSEAELGVAGESDGILVFEAGSFAPGTALFSALPELDDTLFELDVTPNRPDALGHLGVARDLAALLAVPLVPPSPPPFTSDPARKIRDQIGITNRAPERCPRYGAAAVFGCRVAPSPPAIRYRLHRLGIRPISNLVDVTNFAMLLFGHPMHAFDLARIRGRQLEIRVAREAEPFTTLDQVPRRLTADDLVIADAEGATALAGIMGGQLSEIEPGTEDVLLECAYFQPQGIRRSARRFGLHTESSHRFERGVDYSAIERVLDYARGMLSVLAGGVAAEGLFCVEGAEPEVPQIRLRGERLSQLLGAPVPLTEARGILERLGFPVVTQQGDVAVEVRGAPHRPDVRLEADLIEEVARLRGLDQIAPRLPRILPQPPRATVRLERAVISEAVALGLAETVLYSFTSPELLEAARAPVATVQLSNPLSEDRRVMRTSLLPGMLEVVGRARRHGESNLRLFGLGRVFLPVTTELAPELLEVAPRTAEDEGVLPAELPRFMAVLGGVQPSYLTRAASVDVFDAKWIATELIERLTGYAPLIRHQANVPHTAFLHPRASGELWAEQRLVGVFGSLHPSVIDSFDLGETVQVVELYLDALLAVGKKSKRYRTIPRLPAMVRDLCFEVPDTLPAEELRGALAETAGELCESVELFDLFRGGSVAEGQRALAFRLTYRDPKARSNPEAARSLTEPEVEACQKRVTDSVASRFGVRVRAF